MLEQRRREGLPMPKLCYIIPNFHNPTGVTLSRERRARIVELAEEYDFIVIEDNPYGELRFEGSGQPHIKTFDAYGRRFSTLAHTPKSFCPASVSVGSSATKRLFKSWPLPSKVRTFAVDHLDNSLSWSFIAETCWSRFLSS